MLHRKRHWFLSALALLGGGVATRAQNMRVLTDNSGANLNGASHVSDLIAAFAGALTPGSIVQTDINELSNGMTMDPALVTGWNIVLVVTVSGGFIDPGDIGVLQNAVASHASGAFLFFSDACVQCNLDSATKLLSIVNTVWGWSASLGFGDNSGYTGTLSNQPYTWAFTPLLTTCSASYSPLVGVPAANVLFTADALSQDGPMALLAPSTGGSACVLLATDTTEFWTTGGFPVAQANALARACLDAVPTGGCPATLATVASRNCTPPNPDVLSSSLAVINRAWSAEVTHASSPATASTLLVRANAVCVPVPPPLTGRILVGGPLLANFPGSPDALCPLQAKQMNWSFVVPPSALGLVWHAQAVTQGGSGPRLSNAIDGVVGTY